MFSMSPKPELAQLSAALVIGQLVVLVLQYLFGARFFIPKRLWKHMPKVPDNYIFSSVKEFNTKNVTPLYLEDAR